jgi:hypothetical protein
MAICPCITTEVTTAWQENIASDNADHLISKLIRTKKVMRMGEVSDALPKTPLSILGSEDQ